MKTMKNLNNFYVCQGIVWECFCTWRTFKENVMNEMSFDKFISLLDECQNQKEIKELVYKFI